MKTLAIGTHAVLMVAWFGLALPHGSTALEPQTSQKAAAPAAKSAKPARATTAAALDQLLAPIALYPDALLAQMLLSASNPGKVAALAEWLASSDAQRNRASGCRDEVRVRAEPRGPGPLPAGRQRDGRRSGLDDPSRRGLHRRSLGRLRQHPTAAGQGARRREAQKHATTGRRDKDHVQWPAGDRDRAGKPAGRLRSAVQPADRLHHVVHGGRSAGEQHRVLRSPRV